MVHPALQELQVQVELPEQAVQQELMELQELMVQMVLPELREQMVFHLMVLQVSVVVHLAVSQDI